MSGTVSGTVALSMTQMAGAYEDGVRATSVMNNDGSPVVPLSGTTCDLAEVTIPIQIRSNTAYRLLAAARRGGPNISGLLVPGVRRAGTLAAPEAAEAVSVVTDFDGRLGPGKSASANGSDSSDFSVPSELLRGPRVSLGGSLTSPQNAVEVTLSLTVKPRPGCEGWAVELLLSARPV